ncbi:MAG: LPS assembly protein LptD [Rhodospirillaceae bacterium]
MRFCRVAIIILASLALQVAAIAHAAGGSGQLTENKPVTEKKPGQPRGSNEPALLTADEMTSDETLGLVIARGHVELAQGGRTVQADLISYNQKSKVVIASGKVKVFEPTGEVIFTDYAELTDDMRDAFINNIRMILSDNARLAGTEAERTGGRYLRVNHATYSPCYLCTDHPDKAPVWQMRGSKAVHDNEDKEVRYTDAVMDILGTPMFYTPYFSHPDPTVKRRSGFLTPLAGNSSDLGFFVRDSYYFDIEPETDATLETTIFSGQGPMLGGELRHRFDNGDVKMSGSIIHADKTFVASGSGAPAPKKIWRGYFHEASLSEINDSWRWGTNIDHASDQNVMRQFYSYRGNMLTSRGFAEGFFGRDYAGVNAYRFQELRANNTQVAPVVAPLAQYSMMGEPDSLLGGRWTMNSGLVGLTRSTGADSTRVSLEPGWSRELVSDAGLVTTLKARARTDVWNYRDYREPVYYGNNRVALDVRGGRMFDPLTNKVVKVPTPPLQNGAAYRVLPQGQAKIAYPLVRNGDSSQLLFEPMVALTAAPTIKYKGDYPNEDSQDVELDDTSLFQFNRFVGQDRQEGGQRATYGVKAGVVGFNEGSGSIFLGQDYRLGNYSPYGAGTGLSKQRSDYVGRVDAAPFSWLYLNYRANANSDTMNLRRQTVGASVGVPKVSVSAVYHSDDEVADPITAQVHKEQYATFGTSSQLTRYWSATAAHSIAITPDAGPRATGLALSYADECLIFQAMTSLDYTSAPGLGPSETVYFRLVFKGLGEFVSPSISSSSFTAAAH